MVVHALRGSNIPVPPVPEHNFVLSLQAEDSAGLYRALEENCGEAPLTRNFFPAASDDMERRRPKWFINETE